MSKVNVPTLAEIWAQRAALEIRIDKGYALLSATDTWWESNDPKILRAESLLRDLLGQHTDLTAEILMRWKDSNGLTLEWSFPGENGIATVADKWTRCGDSEYSQIVARYTHEEWAACMETVKEA